MSHSYSKEKQKTVQKTSLVVITVLLALLAAGCSQTAVECYQQPLADLSGALASAKDPQLDFQYPLGELGKELDPVPAKFCSRGGRDTFKYHAAEDYHLPAGTPVYAFADGKVSFSGPMGGYGWLVILDHPQHDIYSLYGHLSPSRWQIKSGSVEKGELIGYLGDPDENGGSKENPLIPHLHFGVRVGQRRDYPGWGEWRWMAGWIEPCPSDLGWLRPSAVITGLIHPDSGLSKPQAGLLEKWGSELGLSSIYLVSGVTIWISSSKSKKILPLFIFGGFMIVAGGYFSTKGILIPYLLFFLSAGVMGLGIYKLIQRKGKG